MKRQAEDSTKIFTTYMQYPTESIFKICRESLHLTNKIKKSIRVGKRWNTSQRRYSNAQYKKRCSSLFIKENK